MTRFIAIDPSSTFTGWAVFQDESLVAWGTIDARSAEEYSYRFQFIVDTLTKLANRYHFQEVAIEDVKTAWHSKNRLRNIAGLQIVFRSIQEWAKGIGFPFAAYNPATWKNAVVGISHASKEITENNIRFRFPSLPSKVSEHALDAIAIGVYHAGLMNLIRMGG